MGEEVHVSRHETVDSECVVVGDVVVVGSTDIVLDATDSTMCSCCERGAIHFEEVQFFDGKPLYLIN